MLAQSHTPCLSPNTDLQLAFVFIMHLNVIEYLLKLATQLLDDIQADDVISAFLLSVFLGGGFFCQLRQQCCNMKKEKQWHKRRLVMGLHKDVGLVLMIQTSGSKQRSKQTAAQARISPNREK